MSVGFLGSSPIAKEIENFASDRSAGDGQLPRKIMKKQPTVPPVGEQAPGPSQLDRPIPHLFRLTQYPCRNSVRIVLRRVWYRLDMFVNFLQFQFQFFDTRKRVFYTRMLSLFRSFFLGHCYCSSLRATEAHFGNPKLRSLS